MKEEKNSTVKHHICIPTSRLQKSATHSHLLLLRFLCNSSIVNSVSLAVVLEDP